MKIRGLCLTIVCLTSTLGALAQRPLPDSPRESEHAYVYRLTAEDLQALFRKEREPDTTFLHDYVTRYPTSGEMPALPRGNYLLVQAVGNRIVYTSHAEDDLQYYFPAGKDFQVALLTGAGTPARDARVTLGHRRLHFDEGLMMYTAGDFRRPRLLTIEHEGVYHFVEVTPPRAKNAGTRYSIYRANNRHVSRDFRTGKGFFRRLFGRKDYSAAFLVTNKPKYRPGDTLRWKAFIVQRNGRPLDEPVELHLSDYRQLDTLIATVPPYRPGFYEGEFCLAEGLDLTLDRHHRIALHARPRGNMVANTGFQYEDYELKGMTLSLTSDITRHQRDTTPTLRLKVTDENGMAVPEGRCEISVRPQSPYQFLADTGFVPDVLWTTTEPLDGSEGLTVTLPDSIFPADVAFAYIVTCRYLSADNETHQTTLRLRYDGRPSIIDVTTTDKGLHIAQRTHDQVDTTEADITGFTAEGEVVSRARVTLPVDYHLPGAANYFTIRTDAAETLYAMYHFDKTLVSGTLARATDSVRLQVSNPGGYPYWYRLRRGKSVVEEGYTTATSLSRAYRRGKDYYLQVDYLLGGRLRTLNRECIAQERHIDIRVETPEVVYPGQQTEVALSLTDAKGRPVPDADITAYALTSKFKAAAPYVPSWEEVHTDKYRVFFPARDERAIDRVEQRLDWERWRAEMGLDTIAYYQFLHPAPRYVYTEPAPRAMTQIAPYAVVDGDLQPVLLVTMDGEPVYYHAAEHLPVYSFPVRRDTISLELRLHDRVVRLPRVGVTPGHRNILCVDAKESRKPDGIIVELLPEKLHGRLTPAEIQLLHPYMLGITDNFERYFYFNRNLCLENPLYIGTPQGVYYLNPHRQYQYIRYPRRRTLQQPYSTGPFPMLGNISLWQGDSLIRAFQPEGGYDYLFKKEYMKLTSFDTTRFSGFHSFATPHPDFRTHVLHPDDVTRRYHRDIINALKPIWLHYPARVEQRSPEAGPTTGDNCLQLHFESPRDSAALVFMLLFNEDRTIRWTCLTGQRRWDYLPEGPIEALFVFDDFSCYRRELHLREGGTNYLSLPPLDHLRDTTQRQWLENYLWNELLAEAAAITDHKPVTFPTPRYPNIDETDIVGHISGKVCSAFDGSPIPGATLRIDGTRVGVASDIDGHFTLDVPRDARTFTCSFIGLEPQQFDIHPGAHYNIYMEESTEGLDEIVVTGFGTTRKESAVSAITTMRAADLSRNMAPALAAQDAASSESTANPPATPSLVILNGVPYAGSADDIDPATIASIRRLSPEQGTALYGSMAAGGVVIITTSAPREEGDAGNTLRRNFRDDAFWQPALRTDDRGQATFRVTYPDDVTSWQAHFVAFDGKRRSGYTGTLVRSFKALMARLSLPRFAIAGDSIRAIGRLNNYQGDTIPVTRAIDIEDASSERQILLAESFVDTIPVTAPAADSLRVTYSLRRADGFFDGEQKTIPVLRPGCEESKGIFAVLRDDSLHHFLLDSLTAPVTVHAEASTLDLFLREIEELQRYPYACNEQLASKLKTLLLKRQIYQWTHREFKDDRAVREIITRLVENQNAEGLWGWWDKQASALWISAHVIEALTAAVDAGYQVDFNRRAATQALLLDLRRVYTTDSADMAPRKISWWTSLLALKTLDADIDYRKFVEAVDSIPGHDNLHERLLSLRARQVTGLPVTIDSLMRHSQRTTLGGLFWSDPTARIHLYPNLGDIPNTLLAYRVLRDMGNQVERVAAVQNYFFEVRQPRSWGNTYLSSRVLETLLPDMVAHADTLTASPRLLVNGQPIDSFPFTRQYPAGTPIQVQKSGTSPVFLTAYQTTWNQQPQPVDKDFRVTTSFTQNKITVDTLQAGQEIDLRVEIEASSAAQYVMLEIPIPAGCTYASKNNRAYSSYHTEYWKEKALIFIPYLDKGRYQFSISLLPRYSGRYHLNPARVQLMYFPTFFGRNAMKQIPIR